MVLDVEMPVLDGLGALRELKQRWPTLPVVMFSTLTERGAAATLQALAEGADDYLTKPISATGPAGALSAVSENLVPLLLAWGSIARKRQGRPEPRGGRRSHPHGPGTALPSPRPHRQSRLRRRRWQAPPAPGTGSYGGPGTLPAKPTPGAQTPPALVATGPRAAAQVAAVVIGCSTGGPNALGLVVPALPADLNVPVLVVQHMPSTFTRLLAERLDGQSRLEAHEAAAGMVVRPATSTSPQGAGTWS